MRRIPMLIGGLLAIGLAAAIAIYAIGDDEDSGSTPIPQPSAEQLAVAGADKLPLAPNAKRVDLVLPRFSHPTRITNPLFPISNLRSVVFSGKLLDGPFHTETTLLPETRIVEWHGRQIRTRVSQYMAYVNGRIEEVALDKYAQADDGSVWYFGEDLFDYKDGLVVGTSGTWLAGKNGPPAMIMPGHPQVGQSFRTENIPGRALEEVKVKAVGKTVTGPHGPVTGAMIGQELHVDGPPDDKTFAPGYGEFFTGSGGEIEAMALAVPVDKLPGPPPPALERLSAGANDVFDQVRSKDWKAASATARTIAGAWKTLEAGQQPPRIAREMTGAVKALTGAVGARDQARAGNSAIDVAQSALDLELRHRPQTEIDRARFELWARQILVDASAHDQAGVAGDVTTLEWIEDRFAHTLDRVDVTRIDNQLTALRNNAMDKDLRGASAGAARLRATLAG